MSRETLIASAALLAPPSPGSAAEYAARCEEFAARMNAVMGARPDVERLVGTGNVPMMEENHRNHARFIASILQQYHPQVLVETVLWVFRAYRAHGFSQAYWPVQLDTWVELLQEGLAPEAFREIFPFYRWMKDNLPLFARLTDPFEPPS